MRIDLYLVEKGYFKTRSKASLAIKANAIYVNDKLITKNGFEITDEDKLEIKIETDRYVSRGGYKLEKAIEEFKLDFTNKTVLDIGASTGGFTDCALQNNAAKVYSVDTGVDQLVEELKVNPKVVSMEQTNILDTNIEDKIDFIVMDVSFVSIENMIPALLRYLDENNKIVMLIKPQFEVGKIKMKNGVIKDPKIHLNVLNQVYNALLQAGIYIEKCIVSPILGGSGNKEFLALASKQNCAKPNFNKIVE